jgi:hypothetical protein
MDVFNIINKFKILFLMFFGSCLNCPEIKINT